jgi:hypothetical protein
VRTTLTLDTDVAEGLRQEVRRTGKSFKAAVNDALRAGLGGAGRRQRTKRFTVEPHDFGLRAGVDPDRLNQLVDELDVDAAARNLRG